MKRKLLILSFLSFFFFNSVTAQNWGETNKFLPDSIWRLAGVNFGTSVSISGNYAVVSDPNLYKNTGVVTVFYNNGISWDSIADLTASDGAGGDHFGYSVCISGDVIVVGAYADDDNGYSSGSAYVFEKPLSGWTTMTETAHLTASDGAGGDYFGNSVSISGDVIVVGAYGENDNGTRSGSAYVFEKPVSGWTTMTETAKLTPSDGMAYGNFASSVSISGDIIVIGSKGQYPEISVTGAAYLYQKPASGWATMTETAKLTPSDGAKNDYFGVSVCVSGNVVVVGANGDDDNGSASGSVYVFEKPATGWTSMTQIAKLTSSDGIAYEHFGTSVSISDSVILIGSKGDPDYLDVNGAAYVYEKPSSGWATAIETAKLTASDGAADDQFGYSVCISGDKVLVGAIGNIEIGSAYFFDKPGTNWTAMTETSKHNEYVFEDPVLYNFGSAVSISGDYAVVGSPGVGTNCGNASVLYNNGTNWEKVAELSASDGKANDYFGKSVSISGDVIVVGAYGDDDKGILTGSVYVFEKPLSGWSSMTETARLTSSDGVIYDYFGISVSISGNFIIVGANGDDDNGSASGSAYVFEKPSSGWKNMTQTAKLKPSDGIAYDNFGISVSISNDVIVVGSHGDPNYLDVNGAAYVYEKPAGGWKTATETAKLTASDGAGDDQFGYSVSISGDAIVVGAIGDDDNGSASGSAYVFEKPVSGWITTTEAVKLKPSDGIANENFGVSVSISDDIIVVGSHGDPDHLDVNGAAYVYRKPPSGWATAIETAKLTSSDGTADDQFGYSVGILGDIIFVGAIGDDDMGDASGSAYIFEEFITQRPDDIKDICSESPVQFSITSDKADSYQWQVSSNSGNSFSDLSETSEYAGTKTNTLSVDAKYSMNNYLFRCLITANEYSVFSNKALLCFDSENPVITSTHEDKKLAFGSNCSVVLPDYTGDVTATDNCDNDLTITQSPTAGSSITGPATVTLTATDNMGNPAEVSFDIIVEETEAPVITSVHNDQNLTGDENGELALPDYTGNVTATDNCDNDLEVKQSPAAGSIIFGQNTTVNLIVTDDAGNYSSTSFNVSVSGSSGTSLSGLEQNGISVYPNPVSKTLTIQSDTNPPQYIKILDLTGQVLIEESGSNLNYELDLSGLSSNIYLLFIQLNDGYLYSKFIKN